MHYKELGNTGIQLPEIGLGTYEYHGGTEPLRTGIALGACLIDTAEFYRNEEIVGEAIGNVRDRVFVATKVSPEHFKRADLLRAADRSLQRLKTDHIDLYQLHWPNDAVPIEETMSAMEELVDMGKVRFIGVCNFSFARLKKAQAVLVKHRIVSDQMPYSLADRSIEIDLIPYCQKNRITLIAYSPLARGIDNIKRKDPSGILARVAANAGKTEAQVALNWCIGKEMVIAIPKAASIEHVVENCNASGWHLPADQVRLLENTFPRRGWFQRALRGAARRLLQRMG